MENQTVTIPFEYFKELLEKATQRDVICTITIKDRWVDRDEILNILGALERNEEEE